MTMVDRPFTWNAGDYASNASAQYSWASELITKLALQGDERLLDIGCGDGRITAELSARVPHGRVVGIDASQEMIEAARQCYPRQAHPNLAFRHMDAREIVLDESFDIIFSNAALHWVADHLAVLQGLRRVMRPGGRLL